MKAWIACPVEKVVTSSYVKKITKKLWEDVLIYIILQAVFYTIFVILLNLHIGYVDDDSFNQSLLPVLIIFLIVASAYTILEICIERLSYFKDPWNHFDLIANSLTILYLCMYNADTTEDADQTVLAFANLFSWVRVIGFFRLN